jgi:hypothetical protein
MCCGESHDSHLVNTSFTSPLASAGGVFQTILSLTEQALVRVRFYALANCLFGVHFNYKLLEQVRIPPPLTEGLHSGSKNPLSDIFVSPSLS